MEQFELGVLQSFFFNFYTFFIDFSFTNLSFFLFFFLFFIFFIQFYLIKKINKILSNPLQFFFEKMVLFIINLLKENLKKKDIALFLFAFSILIFIFCSNLLGVFPYTFAITGHLCITFCIAFCIFFGLNFIGFVTHGSYIFSLLLPKGISFIISTLLILIEFISYNFRVISLSVRLFANIMAGHTLLMVVYTFNFFLLKKTSHNFLIVISPAVILPSIVLVLGLICLEFGVAIIQAYVFTLLSIMYFYDAVYLH